MSVRLSRSFKLLFFCFSMELIHFWPSVLHVPLYKTVFFDFWFKPLKPKIYSPKFLAQNRLCRLVWQIDRRCLGLPGVFGDGRFNGTMQNVGPTLVAMATKFVLVAEMQSPTGLSLYKFQSNCLIKMNLKFYNADSLDKAKCNIQYFLHEFVHIILSCHLARASIRVYGNAILFVHFTLCLLLFGLQVKCLCHLTSLVMLCGGEIGA